MSSREHSNLVNIDFMVAKLGKICFGRCVREAKMFLTSGKNIFCFPQHMFSVRLNWNTDLFPSLARPVTPISDI